MDARTLGSLAQQNGAGIPRTWGIPAIFVQTSRQSSVKLATLYQPVPAEQERHFASRLGQPDRDPAHLTWLCSGFRRSIALILSPLRRQRSNMRNSYLAAGFLS